MSEHTAPASNKFYSARKALYLFKNRYGADDRVEEDRKIRPGRLFLVVGGERHAPGTTRQSWILKVIFGENIGWVSTEEKDWTWCIEEVIIPE